MEPDCPSASENRSANENDGFDDELEFGDLMRLMLADFEYWDDVMEKEPEQLQKEPEQLQKAYSVAKEKANALRKYLTAAGMLQNTSRGKRGRFVGVSKASCPRPANRLRHSIERSLQKIFAKGRRNGAGVAEYVWAIGYVDGSIRIGSDEVLAPVWQKEQFMERVREQGNNIKITTHQFKDSLAATDLTTLLSKHLLVAERKAAITTLGRMCTPPMSITPFGMSFAATTLSWWPSGVNYQKAWTLKGHETILVLTAMAENIVTNYGRGSNLSVEDQRRGCIEVFKSCGVGPGVSAGLKECDSKKVAILELIGEQALTAWQLPPSRVAEQEAGSSEQGGGGQGQEAPPPQPRRVRRTKEQLGTQPYPCSLCTGAYSTAAGLRNHRCKARRTPYNHHAPGEGGAGGDTSGEPRTRENPPEEPSPRESPTGESQRKASPPKPNQPGQPLPKQNEPTGSPFKQASGTGAQSFPSVPQPETDRRGADGHQAAAGGGDAGGDSDGAMDELLQEIRSQDVEGQPQKARGHGDVQQEELRPPLPPQLSTFLPLVFALRDKHASRPASGMMELVAKLSILMKEEDLPRELLATLYALNWLTEFVPRTAAYRRACTPTSELFAAAHTQLGVQHLRKGSNGWAAFLKECEFLDEVNSSDGDISAPMAKAQYRLQQIRNNPSLGPSLVAALPRADLATSVHAFCEEAELALRSFSVRQGGVAAVAEKGALSPRKGTGQSNRSSARVDASSPVPSGKETGQSVRGGAGADGRSAAPLGKETGQSDCGGAGIGEGSAVAHGEGSWQSARSGAGVEERSAVPPGERTGQSARGGAGLDERSEVPPGERTGQSARGERTGLSARSGAGVEERSAVPLGERTGQSARGGAGVEKRSAVPLGERTGQSARGGAGSDERSKVPPGKENAQSDRGGAKVDERSTVPPGEQTGQSARGGAGVDERRASPIGERTGPSDRCGAGGDSERRASPFMKETGQPAHAGVVVDRSPLSPEKGTGQSDPGGVGVEKKSAFSREEGTGQSDRGGARVNERPPAPPENETGQSDRSGAGVEERSAVPPGKRTGPSDRAGAGVDERSAIPPGEATGQSARGVAGIDERHAAPLVKETGKSDRGGAGVDSERRAAPLVKEIGQSVRGGVAVDKRSPLPPENGTGQSEHGGAGVDKRSAIPLGNETGQSDRGGRVGKKQTEPGIGEGPPGLCGGMKRTAARGSKRPHSDSPTGECLQKCALGETEAGQVVERTRKESLRRVARGASARAKDTNVSENDPPQPTVIPSERPPKRAASARLVQILRQVTNNKT